MSRPSDLVVARRRIVNMALALAAAALSGCASSHWLEEKKLAKVVFPRGILPIMLFRSDYVRANDREGVTDVVADALASALGQYGISTTVVELGGEPRSPRVELAISRLGYRELNASFPAIVADCAYVSPSEQIAFVGRIDARGPDTGAGSTVDRIAQAIAEKLASLA